MSRARGPGPAGWLPSLRMGGGLGAGDGGAGEMVLQNLLPPKRERHCACRGPPYKTPGPIGRREKPTVVLLHFLQKTKCWKMSTRAVQVRHFPTGQGRVPPNPHPPAYHDAGMLGLMCTALSPRSHSLGLCPPQGVSAPFSLTFCLSMARGRVGKGMSLCWPLDILRHHRPVCQWLIIDSKHMTVNKC